MAPLTLSLNDPLFQTYIVYTTILCLKVLAMAVLTGRMRFSKKIFANPEDAKGIGKCKLDDPDIERVRRAHLNDLENIPVFIVISFLYILTGPSVLLAKLLFRAFTIARIIHTIVYAVVVVRQPARALAFGVGYVISWYMGFQVFTTFMSAL